MRSLGKGNTTRVIHHVGIVVTSIETEVSSYKATLNLQVMDGPFIDPLQKAKAGGIVGSSSSSGGCFPGPAHRLGVYPGRDCLLNSWKNDWDKRSALQFLNDPYDTKETISGCHIKAEVTHGVVR